MQPVAREEVMREISDLLADDCRGRRPAGLVGRMLMGSVMLPRAVEIRLAALGQYLGLCRLDLERTARNGDRRLHRHIGRERRRNEIVHLELRAAQQLRADVDDKFFVLRINQRRTRGDDAPAVGQQFFRLRDVGRVHHERVGQHHEVEAAPVRIHVEHDIRLVQLEQHPSRALIGDGRLRLTAAPALLVDLATDERDARHGLHVIAPRLHGFDFLVGRAD